MMNIENLRPYKTGAFKMGRCAITASIEDGLWHLTVSCPDCSPSYNEIREARYKFIPNDVTMAELYPPKEEIANMHPFCHHLWEIYLKF